MLVPPRRTSYDPGMPREGLSRFFRQVDRLGTSRSPALNAQKSSTEESVVAAPTTPIDDARPSSAPDPLLQDNNGFAKLVGGALAIRGARIQPAISLRGNTLGRFGVSSELAAGDPAFGEALAADRAESMARMRRYVSPALEAADAGFADAVAADSAAVMGESILGESIAGAGLGLADLVPEIAVGALATSGLDYLMRHEYHNSPVQPGEVTFEVDGKTVPAKTFHNKIEKTSSSKPADVSFQRDEAGLDAAYSNSKGTYYDPSTKTEYIKGSTTPTDWYDDFSKIPFGDTAKSEWYSQAMDAYGKLTSSGQPVDRLVGHSLGGAVALEMANNLGKQGIKAATRTFGAPVLDVMPRNFHNVKPERYRHPLDPVSIADRGAKWEKVMTYPHTYTGFQ